MSLQSGIAWSASLSQLKSVYIYHSCLARRSLVCIPHSKGLSVYSESTRSPANENGPIYLRSQKTKQSKRMNAISLDNSLHFSGSPFAFLGIFSLGRGTPNSQLYSSATVWSPKCTLAQNTFCLKHELSQRAIVLHSETYPDIACSPTDLKVIYQK